ncbi:MAG: hypothetical protein PHO32_03705 [Candidatus Cloacimonetes bacterium]|nr:hypothetical protein [Candidatus Cloacimonadota bacterium]
MISLATNSPRLEKHTNFCLNPLEQPCSEDPLSYEIMRYPITVGRSVMHPEILTIRDISYVMEGIKTGCYEDYKLKRSINNLRQMQDKIAQKQAKNRLPWFSGSLMHKKRANANVKQASFMIFDIDHVANPEETEVDFSGFYGYESIYEVFRSIPGNFQLKLGRDVRQIWLNEHDRILNGILDKEDEELLAYATRIYNNVFCSLAIMFTLFKHGEALAKAITTEKCKSFFEGLTVSEETVNQALYLCSYYLENAKPMLTIISEGGSWNNERRIIKHLAKQPGYKDTHSNVMNKLHIKSKELKDCLCNLLEQNAIRTEYLVREGTYKKTLVYRLLPTAGDMYS